MSSLQLFEQSKKLLQKKGITDSIAITSLYWLFENILDCRRVEINTDDEVPPSKIVVIKEAVSRLSLQEPIQYVLEEAYFYGNTFKVNHDVLIPRPETEELVDFIIKKHQLDASSKILDIGTGSGCIAISLAKNLPNAQVYALDISEKAIDLAKENNQLLGADVNFMHQDILEPFATPLQFDIIVSNPPYVTMDEKASMHTNVLDYEPHLALFVTNVDATIFYEAIASFSQSSLVENGMLYFEINEKYGDQVSSHLLKNNFSDVNCWKDMQGKDRFISAKKVL